MTSSPATIPGQLTIPPGEFLHIVINDVPDYLIKQPNVNPYGITVSELAEFLEDRLKLGHISWIDFDTQSGKRSARVRFAFWYNNRSATTVREQILANGQYICSGYWDRQDYHVDIINGHKMTILPLK
jgi:hypothetical protein